MIAASPNWRSRSSRSARLPQCFASDAERFVESTVLPVPPFGEKTVTRRPWRPPPFACCLRPAWQAFLIAKTTLSVSWGSSMTSATSASRASSRRLGELPDASKITGALVYSRIAATSFAGKVALRVACSTTCRCPPVSVDAPSTTLSLKPTSSTSGRFASASRRSGSPSQTPVTKTRTRLVVSISLMLIEDLLVSERSSLTGRETVLQDAPEAVEVIRAVGVVRDRTQLEVPAILTGATRGVGEDVLDLLSLAVGQRQHDVRIRVDRPGELASRGRWRRCSEHPHVANQDAAVEDILRAGQVKRRDEIDTVARLERPGKQLVLVAREGEGAHGAAQLPHDPGLGNRAEALGRDLLARERRLRGDQRLDLVRARDRARNDTAPRHLRRGHLARGVGAGCADRDVVLG